MTAPRAWSCDVEASGTVHADRDRLESALDALIENAVAFTAPGDPVAVNIRREDGSLVLEVRDGGAGIDAGHLDHIFERFARVDGARARGMGAGGTGLGLPIVKAIAEAHGGRVEVRSRPGRGSTFSLVLPGPGSARAPAAHLT